MAKTSAGLLMYRRKRGDLEVLLVHPGGPFWAHKDEGAWSIPKGEYSAGDDPLGTAIREFREETGFQVSGEFIPLSARRQPNGKIITAWALEGDLDPSAIRSNTFAMEWPPHSGSQREFPEVDRAEWFPLEVAKSKITKGQAGFLDELALILKRSADGKP